MEVIDGPQAGTAITADALGQFSLAVAGTIGGTITLRLTKEGYVAETRALNLSAGSLGRNGQFTVFFYLAPLAPPVNIAGDYNLTFIADTACADLPDEVRTRTYAAMITPESVPNIPANTYFRVTVSGAPFLANYKSFHIGVAGDYLGIALDNDGPVLVEQVALNTYLQFWGSAAAFVGTSAVSTISTPFSGEIEYCVLKSAMGSHYDCDPAQAITYAECESTNHRLILTRR